MEQKNVIGNVNVLDCRNLSEETAATVERIGNVNVAICTRETVGLFNKLNVGNLNTVVTLPAGIKVNRVMGQVAINRDYFSPHVEPIYMMIMGQMVVEPDVPAESLEKGLSGLLIMGQLICPEHLAGVLQSKISQVMGQTVNYPPFKTFYNGNLTLNEGYLRSLEDGAELAVVGNLRVPDVLPKDLLEAKISKLFVSGSIRCHEENAPSIQSRLFKTTTPIKVIPAGFRLVEKPLQLDRQTLEAMPTCKLYCTERVVVDAAVEPALLDSRLEGICSDQIIFCPETLRGVLSRKCDLLEYQVIFYEGVLWLFESETTLRPARFEHLDGKATLVVMGEVAVDPEVSPDVLSKKLAKVHNFGEIHCTPAQMAIIELCLGTAEGELVDSTKKDKEEEEEPKGGIGNVNFLEL